MTFSRKVLVLIGSASALLLIFALLSFFVRKRVDGVNEELIDNRIRVFSGIQHVVNDAKSLEAAGSHFLLNGGQEPYDAFIAAHTKFRNAVAALVADPRFDPYAEDLRQIARLEREAFDAGFEAFRARLDGGVSAEGAARLLSRGGLPIVMRMQTLLRSIESRALDAWTETTNKLRDLQRSSRSLLGFSLGAMLCLIVLLVTALGAILRQKSLLDAQTEEILHREQEVSRARKEAVEIVAHDLRNPLSSIRMCLGLLEMESDAETRQLVGAGLRSVDEATRLVETILDHSRIESEKMLLDMAECRIRELLEEQAAIYAALCRERGVEFESRIGDLVANCVCDATRIRQVLSNIIGNALKFSSAGRKVSLKADLADEGLVVAVRDQGPGIAAARMNSIFKAYWRDSTNRVPGVGLGLTIAKSIVEAHGGRIWVESAEGQGSTFYFSIPLAGVGAR